VAATLIGVYREAIEALDYKRMKYSSASLLFKFRASIFVP
jgi:hypothetical protein